MYLNKSLKKKNESVLSPCTAFGVISRFYRKMAGLEKWKDAFKVMRRNCGTDWAQKYPQYAVSAWIGHNIQVSARHYLQAPQELYEKITGTK